MAHLTIHPNPGIEFGNLLNMLRLVKSELTNYIHHESYNSRYVLHGMFGSLNDLEQEICNTYFSENAPVHNKYYFDMANRGRLISKFRRLLNQFLNIKLYDAIGTDELELEVTEARRSEKIYREELELEAA